ncbi:MAG: GPR endopeptidase, partial [Ruminococcus sp.]|nr:GPR endopeptidase [Ruminococcus sp.]
MKLRTDLAIEAREIAGERVAGMDFREYRENDMKISRLTVKNLRAKQILGKEIGTYITIELPSLTDNFR